MISKYRNRYLSILFVVFVMLLLVCNYMNLIQKNKLKVALISAHKGKIVRFFFGYFLASLCHTYDLPCFVALKDN